MRKMSNAEINARLASKEYDDVRERVSMILDQIVNDGPRLIGIAPQVGFALIIYPIAQGETRTVFTTNDPDQRHAAACMRMQAMELDGRRFADVVEQAAQALYKAQWDHEAFPTPWENADDDTRESYRKDAKATLLVAFGAEPVQDNNPPPARA